MSPKQNRRPGGQSRNGGENYGSKGSANVILFLANDNDVSPFNLLTARLIMAQHRASVLSPAVVEALLLGVGLHL